MSILIKGMEMPRKCIRCQVNVYGRCLVNDDKDVSKATADAVRDKDCPLVPIPPRGRLIDADALADVFRGFIAMYGSCPFSLPDIARRNELQSALAEVINAPTIVSAEEGE